MSIEDLQLEAEILQQHIDLAKSQREIFELNATEYREKTAQIEREHQARVAQYQAQQATEFTTGLQNWEPEQLAGNRGWAGVDLGAVHQLTPADLQSLSAEQISAIMSRGKEYENAIWSQMAAASAADDEAKRQAGAYRAGVNKEVLQKLENLPPEDLYRAMNEGGDRAILQALNDAERYGVA